MPLATLIYQVKQQELFHPNLLILSQLSDHNEDTVCETTNQVEVALKEGLDFPQNLYGV